MIPQYSIQEWHEHVPWNTDAMIERECDTEKVMECYKRYMGFVVKRVPSYKEYVQNIQMKMADDEFLTDMNPLLRPDVIFNPEEAYRLVYDRLIDKMEGKRD